ncbi:unnamed protein product [Urochloa humidicola]
MGQGKSSRGDGDGGAPPRDVEAESSSFLLESSFSFLESTFFVDSSGLAAPLRRPAPPPPRHLPPPHLLQITYRRSNRALPATAPVHAALAAAGGRGRGAGGGRRGAGERPRINKRAAAAPMRKRATQRGAIAEGRRWLAGDVESSEQQVAALMRMGTTPRFGHRHRAARRSYALTGRMRRAAALRGAALAAKAELLGGGHYNACRRCRVAGCRPP